MKKVKREWSAYADFWLKSAGKPCDKRIKFILFFQNRSGSNLLRSLFNSHPDILCDREIFAPQQVGKIHFPYAYLNGRCAHCKQQAYGFKVSIKHLARVQNIESKKFLANLSYLNWKIIYLQRQNQLRQAISMQIARIRKRWEDKVVNPLSGEKFQLDCQILNQDLNRIERDLISESRSLEGIPHKTILYERDLLDSEQHQATMDEAFDYLGISRTPVKSDVFRTTSDKMSDFISNYEEVVSFISQSKYAKYLAE